MLKWLKRVLGTDYPEAPVIAQEQPKPAAKPKPQPKKPAKKAKKVDLDAMTKKDLLAHAKTIGVKSNASMSKGAILDAIKNG